MRARVGLVLLLTLTGCRDSTGSADPATSPQDRAEEVRDATQEQQRRVEAPAPAPTPAPAEPASPEPASPPPLVLAQAFCENGADEFSRDILSAVVHVGNAATPPRVLWQGQGSFSSSFGVCQRADVPLAEVPRAGMLRVQQLTKVTFDRDPDLPEIRCRAKKARRRTVAEIAF